MMVKKNKKGYTIKIRMKLFTYPAIHYIEEIPTKKKAIELLEKINKAKRGIEFPDCFIDAKDIKDAEIIEEENETTRNKGSKKST